MEGRPQSDGCHRRPGARPGHKFARRLAARASRLMPDIRTEVAAAPEPVRLAEYRPPAFLIDDVDLVFELGDRTTLVKSRLRIRRNPDSSDPTAALRLDGEELDLVSVAL